MTHPAVRELLQSLGRNHAFQELVSQLVRRETRKLSLSGLTTTAKAIYLVLAWQLTERPLMVLVDGNKQAEALADLARTFFSLLINRPDLPEPQLLPALDTLPHQHLSPHADISAQRALALWRMSTGKAPITIVPAAAALLRTEAPDFYRQLAILLRTGEELPLEM